MPKLLFKLLIISILLLVLVVLLSRMPVSGKHQFGVTFTPKYARYLKLNWQKTYLDMLDTLKVKSVRLPSYWSVLENTEKQIDFSETDFMISEAAKRGVKILLVLGIRQPRWPECHIPVWARSLSVNERQAKAVDFVKAVVERYEKVDSIWAYQLENEPFFSFGQGCDNPDKIFFKKEIVMVKNLSKKPIIVTDSGELGIWFASASFADIFGTTLYRKVYNPLLGYATYPLLPYFYTIKSKLINKKTIIVELQSEPWLANGVMVSPDQQANLFTTGDFSDYVEFAKKTNFEQSYLWGVEWWYFMAQKGYPRYLDYAKGLFR